MRSGTALMREDLFHQLIVNKLQMKFVHSILNCHTYPMFLFKKCPRMLSGFGLWFQVVTHFLDILGWNFNTLVNWEIFKYQRPAMSTVQTLLTKHPVLPMKLSNAPNAPTSTLSETILNRTCVCLYGTQQFCIPISVTGNTAITWMVVKQVIC